jgi:hypothetical protein
MLPMSLYSAGVSVRVMSARGLVTRIADIVPPTRPQRAMVPSTFVNLLGNGLFNTASVLYFTLVVHLSAAQVGIGLTIAGLVGLGAGIPSGRLADRYGPRPLSSPVSDRSVPPWPDGLSAHRPGHSG